jgi:hypothetical protein
MPSPHERRVALVIGNSNYLYGAKLKNPRADARAIAGMLAQLGYHLHLPASDDTEGWWPDADIAEMLRAVSEFSLIVRDADAAVIYFAGHGMEFGGENYLLPINAELKSPEQLQLQALSVEQLMTAVRAVSGFALIILDCCRLNEFEFRIRGQPPVRGGTRKPFASIKPITTRVAVALATARDSPAEDGIDDGNSPYVLGLVEHLTHSTQDIRLVFGKVRDTVLNLTEGRQLPHLYESLGGREVYFDPAVSAERNKQRNHTEYEVDWKQATSQHTIQAYERFLEKWPNATHRAEAVNRRNELLAYLIASGRAMLQPHELEVREILRRQERVPVVVGNGSGDVTKWLTAGDALRDSTSAPEMILIPPIQAGNPYYLMGRFPVTVAEWNAAQMHPSWVATTSRPAQTPHPLAEERKHHPVTNVSWWDAIAYIVWLSRITGKNYRLPTEREWEYCCRAGSITRYSLGDTIQDGDAQFSTSSWGSAKGTIAVGSFAANAFGLCDMHGNVWEWCADPSDIQRGPSVALLDNDPRPRALRGGSWQDTADSLTSFSRIINRPNFAGPIAGFRVIRV